MGPVLTVAPTVRPSLRLPVYGYNNTLITQQLWGKREHNNETKCTFRQKTNSTVTDSGCHSVVTSDHFLRLKLTLCLKGLINSILYRRWEFLTFWTLFYLIFSSSSIIVFMLPLVGNINVMKVKLNKIQVVVRHSL